MRATLTRGLASFQSASFEEAILVGATLSRTYERVNISGARLEAADLSAIAHDDLASCYFKEPPTYDARTKFSAGIRSRRTLMEAGRVAAHRTRVQRPWAGTMPGSAPCSSDRRLIGVFEQPWRKQALHLTAAAGKVDRVQRPPWRRGRELRAGTSRIDV
jgi:hypothetical protein